MKYANMHIHSIYSDGVYSPEEICEKAKELGYGAVVLTDHFTPHAYPRLKKAADSLGLESLLGMEMDGFYKNFQCHIVGYDFDPTEPAMAKYIKDNFDIGMSITKAKFDMLEKMGYTRGITWQEVLDNSPEDAWFCNEHIFAVLVKKTDIEQSDYWSFMDIFGSLKPEGITRWGMNFTAEETIKTIRNAGGVASLAHPHMATQFLPELVKIGLNSVEYDHPDIDEKDISEAKSFAEKNKIYLAGGTDHTGKLSNFPELRGHMPAERLAKLPPEAPCLTPLYEDVRCGVTKEEFDAIKNRIYG